MNRARIVAVVPLESVGKPFRLFPKRFKNVRPGFADGDMSREEAVMLT